MYIRYTVNLLVQTTWIFGTLQRTLGICRLVTVRSKAIEVQHPKKGRWMRHCFKPEWCRGLRSYELWDTFPPPANTSDIKRWHLIFASSFRHNGWWCVGSPSQISENCGFHVSMAGQFLAATVENLPLEKHPKPSVSCARLGTSLGTTTSYSSASRLLKPGRAWKMDWWYILLTNQCSCLPMDTPHAIHSIESPRDDDWLF